MLIKSPYCHLGRHCAAIYDKKVITRRLMYPKQPLQHGGKQASRHQTNSSTKVFLLSKPGAAGLGSRY